MEVFFAVLGALVVFYVVKSLATGVREAGGIENAKDRLFEKAIRDAFISNPKASREDMIEQALDNLSKGGVIHDRAAVRGGIESRMDQVDVYIVAARDSLHVSLSDEQKRKVTRSELVEGARGRVTGATIDKIAAETGEDIDNGVGLRKAIQDFAAADLFTATSALQSADGFRKRGGLVPWPCGQCDLFFRDMSVERCRGCGAEFPFGGGPEDEDGS